LVNTDNQLVTLFADFAAATTSRATSVRPNEAETFTISFTSSDSTIFAKSTSTGKANSPVVSVQFAADEAPAAANIGATAIVTNPGFNVVNFTYETTDPIVDGFVLERNPDAFNASGFGEVSLQAPPTARRFIDTNRVLSGQSYTYRVRAINRLGTTLSNERTVTSEATVPNAPSSLAAGPVLAGDAGEGFFVLTWTRNSTDEDGFIVERRVGGDAFAVVGGTSKGQTTIDQTIDGDPDTTYDYRVIAFNQFGNSAASNTEEVEIE
jgi:titin